MSANTSPIFTLTPVSSTTTISAANTNRDGTGTIYTIASGGSNGSLYNKIMIKATGTTTAGMIRLYLYGPPTNYLWREIAVSAITPSNIIASFTYELSLQGEDALTIPSGYCLRASTHNAETFNITAHGGDF